MLFDVIFKFEGLTKLGLAGLKMESLPEGFGELRSLQKLDLSFCDRLGSLPAGLHIIDHAFFSPISVSTIHSEPPSNSNLILLSEGFGELPALADLDLACCHALAKSEGTYTILGKIPTLTKLSLVNCDMESLPEGAPCTSPSYLTRHSPKVSGSAKTSRRSTSAIARAWGPSQQASTPLMPPCAHTTDPHPYSL